MCTQNASPLVKATAISLLLMILKRSGDVIEWYSNTIGTTDNIGNNYFHVYLFELLLTCV